MYKVLRSTKSAVRFSLKKSKNYLLENSNKESLIFLWFSFGGADKRVSYSTGYTVSYADWDYQKQRLIISYFKCVVFFIDFTGIGFNILLPLYGKNLCDDKSDKQQAKKD